MKKIGIVITDGVGFRNFVLSEFLTEISKAYNQVVIYSGLPQENYKEITLPENIEVKELEIFTESRITWFYRKLKEVAHMTLHKNYYGINNNLKRGYPKKNTKRGILTKIAYKIAGIYHTEKAINKYEKLQFNSFKNNTITQRYLSILKESKPDLLFFTHQRPPYLAPFLYCANVLKIHTTSFIFSWDNLASKGRMMGSFNSYLVWSDLMKKELIHFYPNTIPENVKVIGTPQFEPYVMEQYKTQKSNFFQKFNLDASKKVICYSCADAGIGANDAVHIASVMQYINNNPKLNLQLLVRTSPAEDGLRFEPLKEKFPEIKWNIPKWKLARNNHVESWSQRIPSIEDVIDLRSILEFSSLNINMCSTMGLDFMLFNKPVIYTVFGNETNDLYNDQLFLNYVHLEYVIDSKAVAIAKDETELHAYLTEALEQPELRKENREALIKLEISKTLKGTSNRMAKTLMKWS
ncbi:hypothetical protein [Lacinutrix sp. MedPE-SW]|uniref:hypothetical protein n=1 Tax=Lacinutrix sp. MedPE-SW TaxID=1860087 RepID=UPI0009126235|nr:hypothetical protein [Lacinutrix sp. MedPE-SW]OIQ22714.1 MAG: hypothetical protein BM549_06440 [Lacinutrix sp. MedPE-SW]